MSSLQISNDNAGYLNEMSFIFSTELTGIVSCEDNTVLFHSLPYLYGLDLTMSGYSVKRARLDGVQIKRAKAEELLAILKDERNKVVFDLDSQTLNVVLSPDMPEEMSDHLIERITEMYDRLVGMARSADYNDNMYDHGDD